MSNIPSSGATAGTSTGSNQQQQNTIVLSGDDSDDEMTNVDYSQYSFWNLEYYIPFFNVNTNEVLRRITKPYLFFLNTDESFVSYTKRGKRQSDLWGPFWIITTLIVVIVMTSNIGHFFNLNAIGKDDLLEWTTDFSLISVGATVFYAFSMVVPALLWVAMKYKGVTVSLVETICVYGYSFAVVIPPLVLCMFNITWLRWILIMGGFLYASVFIVFGLFKEWKKVVTGPQDNIFLLVFAAFIVLSHLILAVFVKFYFYTFSVDLK
ncbi:predicted protein [Naegleria gruberi]|uniref:Protein YIPF n=1 Tax=Naegleria gruberi TaxID=5762 RepID=D2UZ87_NAEGR|nr:uncharacterized protein NAEGRDRAFT_29707 [Naegleria gruberi]EFC49901.1 predicted protein [Naegleria gruberi]|eukprot:XP_002682645.1 predicted protein [Naegleria gruberi strain NEG-M]